MDTRFVLALLLALACLNQCGRSPRAAALPLTFTIVPRVAIEPAELLARFALTPDSANRDLCVLWDSTDAGEGAECWPPRATSHFDVPLIHPFETGHYVFWAELTRQEDERTKTYATPLVDVVVE